MKKAWIWWLVLAFLIMLPSIFRTAGFKRPQFVGMVLIAGASTGKAPVHGTAVYANGEGSNAVHHLVHSIPSRVSDKNR